jgi:polysaccharide export outer membrane protein
MSQLKRCDIHLRVPGIDSFFLILVLLASLALFSTAVLARQEPVVSSPSNKAAPASHDASSSTSQADNRYRIGPGDVLEIRVLKAPELSRDAVRVDQNGMIRIPMIDDDIQATCLTEGELSKLIATRYLKYKRNPHVDVFVKEYQSQVVAVVGAVNQPAQFKMQRQLRLLELLTAAGGPHERAGRSVQVVHTSAPERCQKASEPNESQTLAKNFSVYDLSETMRGEERANPVVRPGDVITVPDADQAYVVGNVYQPRSISLKEPLSVSRAIAMAGGTQRDTKTDRVRIVRQTRDSGTKQEIYVDLKAIEKRKAEDVALQANDIVDVPTSGAKSVLHGLLGTIAPTISQLPVRVIP